MKQFAYYILFLICLCLLLANCKHEPVIDPNGPQCGEATTIDEMMEWVYFKTGTYWIYEEQNTGALDTVTVVDDYSGTSGGFRDFLTIMQSSYDGYFYKYWFNDSYSTESTLVPGCILHAVDCDKYIPGDYAGGNRTFVFPLRVGNRASQSGGGLDFGFTTNVGNINADSIHSSLYYNVFEFHQDYSPQHNYEASNYKITKNIGIVEKTVPIFSQEWQLIEFQINQ
ncbi:MAG: hypothetical protein ACKVOK_04490 [Flavobacteriales bacterium]